MCTRRFQLAHDSTERQLPALEAFRRWQQAALFNSAAIIRVVIVRDPLERLLSAYLDKCAFRHSQSEASAGAPLLLTHCPGYYYNAHRSSFSSAAGYRSRPKQLSRAAFAAAFAAHTAPSPQLLPVRLLCQGEAWWLIGAAV